MTSLGQEQADGKALRGCLLEHFVRHEHDALNRINAQQYTIREPQARCDFVVEVDVPWKGSKVIFS